MGHWGLPRIEVARMKIGHYVVRLFHQGFYEHVRHDSEISSAGIYDRSPQKVSQTYWKFFQRSVCSPNKEGGRGEFRYSAEFVLGGEDRTIVTKAQFFRSKAHRLFRVIENDGTR